MIAAATWLAALPCLALAAGHPAAAPYPVPSLDEGERARLLDGEVLMRDLETQQRAGGGEVIMLAHGPAREVWRVVVSCELALSYVAGMQHCESVRGDEREALVHQVVDKGWWMPELDYRIQVRRSPFEWMTVTLESGNLAGLDGAWRFAPWPATGSDTTLVAHRIVIEPERRAPGWLVRRTLRGDLPDMMACIRALADASPPAPGRDADLARCPGPLPGPLPED